MSKTKFGIWILVIGIYLVLGVWCFSYIHILSMITSPASRISSLKSAITIVRGNG
jgi:hypothetical protein